MILDFGDQATEDLFNGTDSKAARRIPPGLWSTAIRKLDMLNAARESRDLQFPSGNRLKKLKHRLASFHSIRINDQYRVIFRWLEGNAREVQITNYH